MKIMDRITENLVFLHVYPLSKNWSFHRSVINNIEVDNIDDYLTKIHENGGETIIPKMKIPSGGFFAHCQGPDGIIFGIYQREEKA